MLWGSEDHVRDLFADTGLELEKFDTAGTSEEDGNVREEVAHHHDFDELGGLPQRGRQFRIDPVHAGSAGGVHTT